MALIIINRSKTKIAVDLLFLTLLCLPLYYIILTTQTDSVGLSDVAWYLNRAHLYENGVFRGPFVYTLIFPILTGIIDYLIHDLILAGLIVNGLALYSITIGTYILGRSFYHRPVACLAAIVIALSLTLVQAGRGLVADTLFSAVLVWCVVAYYLLVRYQTWPAALLLGVVLVIALFTRLEGGAYGILIIAAFWQITRTTHNWRLALRVCAVSSIILILGMALYALVLLRYSDPGGNAFSLFRMFSETPIPWDLLSRRFSDTLLTTLSHWPLWAWSIVLAALIWQDKTYRIVNFCLAALIVFNVVYAFLLSIWPYPRNTGQYLPFFALLFAAAAYRLGVSSRRFPILAPLLIMAICLPGLQTIAKFTDIKPFAYRDSQLARTGHAVDAWLQAHGFQDTEIYTLCSEVLPYTRGHFYEIYRLVIGSDTSASWDNPANLLPYLRETDKLLMTCNEPIYFADWKRFFESKGTLNNGGEKLEELGRVDSYVFYRVTHAS